MSTVSPQRKMLIGLVNDIPEEKLPHIIDCVMREVIGYDEDEPPLTEEELREIAISEQEIAEGKGIPLSELLKEFANELESNNSTCSQETYCENSAA
ncbi:MAG: hypothetical protein IJS28_10715 [Synergistaceae bacterium]|nr:hypothetical protein [Synergistaceae bacterium]